MKKLLALLVCLSLVGFAYGCKKSGEAEGTTPDKETTTEETMTEGETETETEVTEETTEETTETEGTEGEEAE
jgi:hypothetical protein